VSAVAFETLPSAANEPVDFRLAQTVVAHFQKTLTTDRKQVSPPFPKPHPPTHTP